MEEYKVIPGHKNYSVSNYGNIRKNKTGKILKASLDGKGYKTVALDDGKNHRVHRLLASAFIPNPNSKQCVDHIDNDRTNNNLNNLRWVTKQENNFNRSLSKNNISGHVGVGWNKNTNKWRATITYNRKKYHLGLFDKIEDAILARQKRANEIFGEFAHQSQKLVNVNSNHTVNTIMNINIKVVEVC